MRSVIIVAGGRGSRMQSDIPKQFLEIHNKPVVVWTIEKFLKFDSEIQVILVLPSSMEFFWLQLFGRYRFLKSVETISGGSTRFLSVLNGLSLAHPGNIIGIHDAVRPLVSTATIERCYDEAERSGSAVPVIETEDTLRKISGKGSLVIDRTQIRRVQTPQVFQGEKILKAYNSSVGKDFTDDASVYESYYGNLSLVEGNRENMKLTYPADIKYAEVMLSKKD